MKSPAQLGHGGNPYDLSGESHRGCTICSIVDIVDGMYMDNHGHRWDMYSDLYLFQPYLNDQSDSK